MPPKFPLCTLACCMPMETNRNNKWQQRAAFPLETSVELLLTCSLDRWHASIRQKVDDGQGGEAGAGGQTSVHAGGKTQVSDANVRRQQCVQPDTTAVKRRHQRQRHIQRQPKSSVRAWRRRAADADDQLKIKTFSNNNNNFCYSYIHI